MEDDVDSSVSEAVPEDGECDLTLRVVFDNRRARMLSTI